MDNKEYLEILEAEIKKIQHSSPDSSEKRIAEYLESSLKTYSPEQQIAVIDGLIDRFASADDWQETPSVSSQHSAGKSTLLAILGESENESLDLSQEELDRRINTAFETIFAQLNEITIGITASFSDQPPAQPTIQKALMAYIAGTDSLEELKSHLAIVKNVFALTHQAFTQAVGNKIKEILDELDPEQIDDLNNSGGLNFGAFQKAKKFDMLKQKHQTLSRWFDSGLLNEALLKEFERIYQKLYAENREET